MACVSLCHDFLLWEWNIRAGPAIWRIALPGFLLNTGSNTDCKSPWRGRRRPMEPTCIGELAQASALRPPPIPRGNSARRAAPKARAARAARPFDLLRWFSIASLVALIPVAAAIGAILSHFVAEQTLRRDAMLTAEFIRNCLVVESASLGATGLGPYLDQRLDPALAGLDREAVDRARPEMFEHLEVLPGAVVTNVYAADRMVVWSTNSALVGT